jgi:ribosomal protein S18 acetylase RimI-like enzyme
MTPIESATPQDFDAIAALNLIAYDEFAVHLKPDAWARMRQNITNIDERATTQEFFVARDAGGIVGSVAYAKAGEADPAFFKPGMAAALLLAVHPAHRGRGLARQLMAACIERARRDKADSLALFTSELMQPAQALYHNLGFLFDAELPPRHGVTYVRFVFPLRNQA